MVQFKDKVLNKENFNKNYSISMMASGLIFSFYFVSFLFLLNLLYVQSAFNKSGLSGVLILFSYYLVSSIALMPILYVLNSLIGLIIKFVMRPIYIYKKILGFILFPLAMSLIPFFMAEIIDCLKFKLSTIDCYFLYGATWISAVIQYRWILDNFASDHVDKMLTKKQLKYLQKIDSTDYF